MGCAHLDASLCGDVENLCSSRHVRNATRVATCATKAHGLWKKERPVRHHRRVSPLPPVSRTAIGVARVRAGESARPDPLFTDPYAAAFVSAAGSEQVSPAAADMTDDQRRWRSAIAFHIVIRTRFFDDYLTDAVGGGCEQVVLLGAGLDTRAFRCEWPATLPWFELDLPEVLTFKQTVLDRHAAAPRCDRRAVVADLAGDWAAQLRDVGHRPAAPTAWLAEGLLVYLDGETAAHVLGTATTLSARGSRLALERGDVATQVATTDTAERPDEASELWRGGLVQNPAAWLAERGWRATEHETGDVATSYGRRAPASARSGFVTATR
jgi:methyltransferase (TIGR00027 family)